MDKYTIELPIIRESVSHSGLLDITKSSPVEYRDALEKLALYFKREFKYDSIQFTANEHFQGHSEYKGFAFTKPAPGSMKKEYPEIPTRFIGGDCFRKDGSNDHEYWCLDWVWIHPYERNKGLFSTHIEYFKEKFGDFIPEGPLSKAMHHIYFSKVST